MGTTKYSKEDLQALQILNLDYIACSSDGGIYAFIDKPILDAEGEWYDPQYPQLKTILQWSKYVHLFNSLSSLEPISVKQLLSEFDKPEELTDYEIEYNNFWKNIVENADGTINKDQLMRELSDYSILIEGVPKVYDAVTDGAVSYPNIHASKVISTFESRFIPVRNAWCYLDDIADMEDKQECVSYIASIVRGFITKYKESYKVDDEKVTKVLEKLQEIELGN